MFCLTTNLKIIKNKALEWNKNNFNNIFEEKNQLEKEITNLNNIVIEQGMNDLSYHKEKELLAKYNDILLKEEIFRKQKSRESWLKEGDSNTKFFHNTTNYKRSINRIVKIKTPEGCITEDPDQIATVIINFYKSLLNNIEAVDLNAQNDMLKAKPKLITESDNKIMNNKLSLEEVKTAVFQLHPDKAPRPDGFQAGFFQKCWHFVGEEIWQAVEATKNSSSLLNEINNTFFTLILKKNDSADLGDFRPISLCNTIYKILSKCLANRLKTFLPTIISEEQTGFVANRSILDGIIIPQEIVHTTQLTKEPSMLMKIDIQKAYDKVDWRFLCKCMEAFGFSKQWVNLIFNCILTPKISILINGTLEGFFNISRGIRQGDLLSPFLYVIMAEALGRSITKYRVEGKILGLKASKNVPNITHQQFTDDMIRPGYANRQEVSAFKEVLNLYVKASGHCVNPSKSEIFFINTCLKIEKEICRMMGYKIGKFPCKYLGIDLDKGIQSSKLWQQVITKVQNKKSSWKGKWLTKQVE